jgi:hypothetical protein
MYFRATPLAPRTFDYHWANIKFASEPVNSFFKRKSAQQLIIIVPLGALVVASPSIKL